MATTVGGSVPVAVWLAVWLGATDDGDPVASVVGTGVGVDVPTDPVRTANENSPLIG